MVSQINQESCFSDCIIISSLDMSTSMKFKYVTNEPVCEKTNNLGSDQVRHKPGCTNTEDGLRLEILDLESREIVLTERRKQRC